MHRSGDPQLVVRALALDHERRELRRLAQNVHIGPRVRRGRDGRAMQLAQRVAVQGENRFDVDRGPTVRGVAYGRRFFLPIAEQAHGARGRGAQTLHAG